MLVHPEFFNFSAKTVGDGSGSAKENGKDGLGSAARCVRASLPAGLKLFLIFTLKLAESFPFKSQIVFPFERSRKLHSKKNLFYSPWGPFVIRGFILHFFLGAILLQMARGVWLNSIIHPLQMVCTFRRWPRLSTRAPVLTPYP